MDMELPMDSNDPKVSTTKDETTQSTPDSSENSETTNDIKNKTNSNSNSNEGDETKEQIVGEITFTDPENVTSDSKGNLAIDDMPTGISGMQPLEISSVISEPIDVGVPDTTTSVNLNNSSLSLPCQTSDESRKSANKARLKSCIIKLTELSNSEHEKWLTSESGSTQTNISVESVEHSTSSGSRYNMRSRPTPVSARHTRRT